MYFSSSSVAASSSSIAPILCPSRLAAVDWFWREKAWILLDHLQVYALLWQLSLPWPWPRFWLIATRWTLAFNVDAIGLLPGGASMGITGTGARTVGTYDGYLRYAYLWTIVPLVLAALWMWGALRSRRVGAIWTVDWRTANVESATMRWQNGLACQAAALLLGHVLFLPIGLALGRVFICDDDGNLAADAAVQCGSPLRIACAAVINTVLAACGWSLSAATLRLSCRAASFSCRRDHERSLVLAELEYVCGVGDSWTADHLWLVSGFRRRAAFQRVGMLWQKALLLAVYVGLGSAVALQAVLFWLVVSAWTVYSCARGPPYRCQSSSVLYVILQLSLLVTTSLGMLTGYGAQNAFLVASNQYFYLKLVNTTALVIAALYLGYVAFLRRRAAVQSRLDVGDNGSGGKARKDDSSAASALGLGVPDAHAWPIYALLAAVLGDPAKREGLAAAATAQRMAAGCRTVPASLVPLHRVDAHAAALQAHWVAAKSEGSLLEPLLGEALAELARVRGGPGAAASLLPGPHGVLAAQLEDAAFRAGLRRRASAVAFADRPRRVFFLKLMALAIFRKHCKRWPEVTVQGKAAGPGPGSALDLLPLSPATLGQMTAKVEQVLALSASPARQAALASLLLEMKAIVQPYEARFFEVHGRPPNSGDEALCGDFVSYVQRLEVALGLSAAERRSSARALARPSDPIQGDSRITARGDGDGSINTNNGRRGGQSGAGGGQSGGGGGRSRRRRTMYDLTQHLAELTHRADALLLLAAGRTDTNVAAMGIRIDAHAQDEVEDCRRAWKQVIRTWEFDFAHAYGRKPEIDDKRQIETWYQTHERLGRLHPTEGRA
ncbi:unnamed protein product [Phaeothamnion confervicola]